MVEDLSGSTTPGNGPFCFVRILGNTALARRLFPDYIAARAPARAARPAVLRRAGPTAFGSPRSNRLAEHLGVAATITAPPADRFPTRGAFNRLSDRVFSRKRVDSREDTCGICRRSSWEVPRPLIHPETASRHRPSVRLDQLLRDFTKRTTIGSRPLEASVCAAMIPAMAELLPDPRASSADSHRDHERGLVRLALRHHLRFAAGASSRSSQMPTGSPIPNHRRITTRAPTACSTRASGTDTRARVIAEP